MQRGATHVNIACDADLVRLVVSLIGRLMMILAFSDFQLLPCSSFSATYNLIEAALIFFCVIVITKQSICRQWFDNLRPVILDAILNYTYGYRMRCGSCKIGCQYDQTSGDDLNIFILSFAFMFLVQCYIQSG